MHGISYLKIQMNPNFIDSMSLAITVVQGASWRWSVFFYFSILRGMN
jgi:hypothetical protein